MRLLTLLTAACLSIFAQAADLKDTVLAHFPFSADGKDALGKCADADLKSVEFKDGAMFLNGFYVNGGNEDGYRATVKTPGLSYDKFTFSLDFCPNDFDEHQKSGFNHNTIIVGGTSYRWLAINHGDGYLTVLLNNQEIKHELPKEVLAVKKWHNLICSVDVPAKRILLVLDGRALDPINLGENFKFEVVGSTAETTDKNFTFTNYSNGNTYKGYVANLKIFNAALSFDEMKALAEINKPEQPKATLPFKRKG